MDRSEEAFDYSLLATRYSRLSIRHQPDRLLGLVEHAQHAIELGPAPHDQAGRRDHAVGALAARQLGVLFDEVDRHFGGMAEDREDGAIAQEIDGGVTPFSGGNPPAIHAQNAVEP